MEWTKKLMGCFECHHLHLPILVVNTLSFGSIPPHHPSHFLPKHTVVNRQQNWSYSKQFHYWPILRLLSPVLLTANHEMPELFSAKSVHAYRQERRTRRSDFQLREIMDETWRWQDGSAAIRGYPKFVVKYIRDPFLTTEKKAVLLWDRVETNLIRRLNTQPRSVLLTPITNIFTDTKPRPANSHETIYFWPVQKSHGFCMVPHKACSSWNTLTASSHYPWRAVFRSECLQTGYWTQSCQKRRTGIPRPQHNRKRIRPFGTLGSIPCREGRSLYTCRYDSRPYWGLWELGKDGASWWKWTT